MPTVTRPSQGISTKYPRRDLVNYVELLRIRAERLQRELDSFREAKEAEMATLYTVASELQRLADSMPNDPEPPSL